MRGVSGRGCSQEFDRSLEMAVVEKDLMRDFFWCSQEFDRSLKMAVVDQDEGGLEEKGCKDERSPCGSCQGGAGLPPVAVSGENGRGS